MPPADREGVHRRPTFVRAIVIEANRPSSPSKFAKSESKNLSEENPL
jgi:hypothetical protein